MSVAILKYGLPALLGYILFIGISGRLNPFAKPAQLPTRPSWFLGVWTGLAVAGVLTLALHMAYGTSLENAQGLFMPGAIALGALMLIGLVGFFIYKRKINSAILRQDTTLSDSFESIDTVIAGDLDGTMISDAGTVTGLDQQHSDELEEQSILEAALAQAAAEDDIDEFDKTLGLSDAFDLDYKEENKTADAVNEAKDLESNAELTDSASRSIETADHTLAFTYPAPESEVDADKVEDMQLKSVLEQEISLRQETEKHLLITRKALSVLESESRSYEMSKAEALTHLEAELDNRIRQTAKAEARGNREAAMRQSMEGDVLLAKQELAEAKKELRKSTEARAKAISTADRAITYAKRAISSRSTAENRIKELEASMANRQATISSLIQSLETEKRRSQTDIQSMAKQMLMEEKQTRARRRLDEAARRVEGKLANRLVKKVARSRTTVAGET